MIDEKVKYALSDLVIKPCAISSIDSRSECNPFNEDGFLPLITSPMYSVVDDKNISYFTDNKIYGVYPRGNIVEQPLPNTFTAYGLDEFIEKFLNNTPNMNFNRCVMIDMANGHMIKLLETTKKAKLKYGDSILLCVGNIANPETYGLLAEAGADYLRLGIGTGQPCFVEGTKVLLKNGEKSIEDVIIGDLVFTHDGTAQEVIATSSHKEKDTLIKINDTVSTKEHLYYVVNKNHKNVVTDENIHDFAQWVEAKNLTEDYLLIDLA